MVHCPKSPGWLVGGGGLFTAAPQFGQAEQADRRHWYCGWETPVEGGGVNL